jgi:hypothetical protein
MPSHRSGLTRPSASTASGADPPRRSPGWTPFTLQALGDPAEQRSVRQDYGPDESHQPGDVLAGVLAQRTIDTVKQRVKRPASLLGGLFTRPHHRATRRSAITTTVTTTSPAAESRAALRGSRAVDNRP